MKPSQCLHKRLFLRKLNLRLVKVTPNGETMRNPAKEVNLKRLSGLNQDLLRRVAVAGGEDSIVLWGD